MADEAEPVNEEEVERLADRRAKWERQKAAEEARYEAQRLDERSKHADVVEAALRQRLGGFTPHFLHTVALAAVDALIADGVVFARMGSWRERACYECGLDVADGEGEQHGRAGWVHFACNP